MSDLGYVRPKCPNVLRGDRGVLPCDHEMRFHTRGEWVCPFCGARYEFGTMMVLECPEVPIEQYGPHSQFARQIMAAREEQSHGNRLRDEFDEFEKTVIAQRESMRDWRK